MRHSLFVFLYNCNVISEFRILVTIVNNIKKVCDVNQK